jgi:hypothetical protein
MLLVLAALDRRVLAWCSSRRLVLLRLLALLALQEQVLQADCVRKLPCDVWYMEVIY